MFWQITNLWAPERNNRSPPGLQRRHETATIFVSRQLWPTVPGRFNPQPTRGEIKTMNGAESLVHSLLKSGVDTCFSSPGTSEMHFVAALDRVPGMRCVLGLFEGVVTGAADGYARVTRIPAARRLHCVPGLANGLANLHNARRAATPIVNIVGDHATYHRPLDAPLTADTEGWARGVSGWVRTAMDVKTVGRDAAAAVQASMIAPGQIATLILPSDTSWNDGGIPAEALPRLPPPFARPNQIKESAPILG